MAFHPPPGQDATGKDSSINATGTNVEPAI